MPDSTSNYPLLVDENRQLKNELEAYKKSAEEHIAKQQLSEQRFRLALRGANDGLWDWDMATDEVYYSPRWKSMLGYEEDELENVLDTWANLVHPDEKHIVLGKVEDYLSGKADSFEVEMRMKHKDGHYVFVLSRAFSQFRKSDGKPLRLVGTHVDISARKKAELFNRKTAQILEMIAIGKPASEIYDAIALMYESRHPGMRCSMLELEMVFCFMVGRQACRKPIAMPFMALNTALMSVHAEPRLTPEKGVWSKILKQTRSGRISKV